MTMNKQEMKRRFHLLIHSFGWKMLIAILRQRNINIRDLNVIEIGCGTGTFTLSLALLGAKVTLLDINEDALNEAKKIYSFYNLEPNLILGNVLDKAPSSLYAKFDLAVSVGLAEHFLGSDRKRCLEFHKEVLKSGGIAWIEVPNKCCVWYQLMRIIKILIGTWPKIIERPFSRGELAHLARSVGFDKYLIKSYNLLIDDFPRHLRTYISDLMSFIPDKSIIRRKFNDMRSNYVKDILVAYDKEDIAAVIRNKAEEKSLSSLDYFMRPNLSDYFGAAIVLFGFIEE